MLNTTCSLLPICLYLMTFVIVLPVICFVLPLHHSIYYQLFRSVAVLWMPDVTSQMDTDLFSKLFAKNSEQVDVAYRFLEQQQSKFVVKNISTLPTKYQMKTHFEDDAHVAQEVEHVTYDSNVAVTVSVVVVSAGRDEVVSSGEKYTSHYLTQNIARFMTLISDQRHFDKVSYQLLVCSVGEHFTSEEQSVGRVVQVVRNPQMNSGFTFGPFHDRLAWRYEKEKRDYTFCLQQAVRDAEFLLIVEDDALPMTESLSVVSRLVTGHWTSRSGGHTVGERFYVKLYHPVHLQGYASLETERIPELVAAAIVLGSCVCFIINLCASDGSLIRQRLSWIQCCVYCGLIALCVGRVHMHSWRRLLAPYAHYLVSDKFCCTQAILYTAQTALDLAAYLERTSCNETYHKDEALWKFPTSGYLVQPNVFEHVGIWSSVRRGFVDPNTII